jgi:hypothetical protein
MPAPQVSPLEVSERVVLVPRRRTMSATQAYAVASEKLEEQGLTPIQLSDAVVERDEATAMETFVLRIDVAPTSEADVDEMSSPFEPVG